MYPRSGLDREAPAVGEEAVGGGVGAVRAITEEEGAVGEEVGDRGEVGDAAGDIGFGTKFLRQRCRSADCSIVVPG
jgi:hypothetical protein